jgi:phage replication-related protein YjqB (UPF0714/DUF867 family)
MADKYASFAEMAEHETENVDYKIRHKIRGSAVAIVAPHGGGIEPGTAELAAAIAGEDLSFYIFEATKPSHNRDLHITSTNFFEDRCNRVIASCAMVVTVHGKEGKTSVAFMGGKDDATAVDANALRQKIEDALTSSTFSVLPSPEDLSGRADKNLCNRGTSGAGVQLELTHGLRASMFENVDNPAGRKTVKQPFHDFVAAIRNAIEPPPSAA